MLAIWVDSIRSPGLQVREKCLSCPSGPTGKQAHDGAWILSLTGLLELFEQFSRRPVQMFSSLSQKPRLSRQHHTWTLTPPRSHVARLLLERRVGTFLDRLRSASGTMAVAQPSPTGPSGPQSAAQVPGRAGSGGAGFGGGRMAPTRLACPEDSSDPVRRTRHIG